VNLPGGVTVAESDPYRLQRFLDAQRDIYDGVARELRAGRKRSHWIWFIFPQIAGLGSSPTSQLYAIQSLAEAQAYARHPVLGARLRECAQLVVDVDGRSVEEILPYPDDLKFRSSMTLFSRAIPEEPVFAAALARYFAGEPDKLTLQQLG
jgi:uncharacterized protein (DUF1810 family)